jgi:peptidoglycan/xylan/chitin deacetylase (PgdA/CDA1 family)
MQTGNIVMSKVSLFSYCLMAIALSASLAHAQCGPETLGVDRVLTVSRTQGTAVGLQSYPRTLALNDHEVVLTFDDGPAAPTAKLLDALAKECVKATFFIIGHNAEAQPSLVKRTADEGHSIAHHSYSHPSQTLRLMDDAAAKADIEKGIAAVTKAAGGTSTNFFRFPGFADTQSLKDSLIARGYTIFGSDIWASDWRDMTPKAELDLVLSRLEKAGKGIILFHDSKLQTAQMLPEFLHELKTRGFHVVHIVPGDEPTPLTQADQNWTSTTEPIIAKTLSGYSNESKSKPAHDAHSHEHGVETETGKDPAPATQQQ